MPSLPLIPTTLVGSYPQPDWLIDKEKLMAKGPPRVRMTEVWKFAGDELQAKQDEAVTLVVADQEAAGIDVLTDGEVRRESYFNQFANALSGIDLDHPAEVLSRIGRPTLVPRVAGPVAREKPVFVRDVEYLRAATDKAIKVTVPGPFTMTRLAVDEHYNDEKALIEAYADAVNAELRDLKAAGADVVQLDEPYLQSNAEEARVHGIAAIDRAFDGIDGAKAIHLCFGYAYVVKDKPSGYSFLAELAASSADQISVEAAEPHLDPAVLDTLPGKTVIYGVLNLAEETVERPDDISAALVGAAEHVGPERLIAAPDCGMKYLPRDVAFAKLQAMTEGAAMARAALGAG